jgi:hypothetical protein
VARRRRILAFGSAGVLVVAGAMTAIVAGDANGALVAIVLITLGLGGALLLVFLEIGLSEDRERAAAQERRRKRPRHIADRPRSTLPRKPRRPG